MVRQFCVVLAIMGMVVFDVGPSGQVLAVPLGEAFGVARIEGNPSDQGFGVSLGLRKYFSSFTSYQMPGEPGTALQGVDPVSRTEWPWDQTYAVAKLGYGFSSVAVNVEGAATLSPVSSLEQQDTDWQNPADPGQVTTVSKSKANPRGWIVDISASWTVPDLSALRPILGFRAQQLKFTKEGGTEWSIWAGSYTPRYATPLPGVRDEFSQRYDQWYLGGILKQDFFLPEYVGTFGLSRLSTILQLDCGYALGRLLNEAVWRGIGLRVAERTAGFCWHANVATSLYSGTNLRIDVETDFKRIRTNGSHGWTDNVSGYSRTWDGAKVWSDQAYVSVTGRYSF